MSAGLVNLLRMEGTVVSGVIWTLAVLLIGIVVSS